MINIIGIKCKNKFYISEFRLKYSSRYDFPDELIINGLSIKRTFHPNWGLINEKPIMVQKYVRQPDINHRYELFDPATKSDKIKSVLKREEVLEYINGEWDWKSKYNAYRSLYKAVSDKQPDILENVDFTYETIIEVKEIKEYKGFAYDVQKTRWAHQGLRKLRENDVYHQLLDKIIFPDILLQARPCSLTPKQSFDIVRQYIKQHINYDVASITSDYNFCFTVKKKIFLSAPEKYTVNVNKLWYLKKGTKTKYTAEYKKPEEIECFSMAPEKYSSYKIIEGFRGETQEDLKNNIDNYCKKLIKFINEPVVNCPCCKGRGIVDEKIPNEVTKE